MKGRYNWLNDVVEFFGESREDMERHLDAGDKMLEDGAVVFHHHDDYIFFLCRDRGNMVGVVKSPEGVELYKWKPRKEAA